MEGEAPSQSARDGKRPEIDPTEHQVARRASAIPLYQMVFAIHIFDPPGTNESVTVEFVTARCLYPESPLGDRPSDYKIELLRKQYKNRLDDREDLPWEVEVQPNRGEFRYSHQGELRTVKTQDDFEIAIARLYNGGRCDRETLSFSFEPNSYRSRTTGAFMEKVAIRPKPQGPPKKSSVRKQNPGTKSASSTSKAAQVLGLPGTKTNLPREMPKTPARPLGGSRGGVPAAPARQSKAPSRSDSLTSNPSRHTAGTQSVGQTPKQQSAAQSAASNRSITPSETLGGRSQAPVTPRTNSKSPTPAELQVKIKELQTRTAYLRSRPNNANAEAMLRACNFDVDTAVARITKPAKNTSEPISGGNSRNQTPNPNPVTPKTATSDGKEVVTAEPPRRFGGVSQPAKRQPGTVTSSVTAGTTAPASKLPRQRPQHTSQSAGLQPGTTSSKAASSPLTPASNLSRQTNTSSTSTTVRTNPSSTAPSGGKKPSETFQSKVKRNLTIRSSTPSSLPHSSRSRLSGLFEAVKSPFMPKPKGTHEQDEKYGKLFTQTRTEVFIRGGDTDPAEAGGAGVGRERLARGITDDEVYDELGLFDDNDEMEKESEPKAKLKDLQILDSLEQLDSDNGKAYWWRECCRMFGIDERKTGIDERVKIFGIRTPLFQYQAFAVYWAMLNARAVGGGIIADTPGLGKTLIFMAYIIVERQLVMLWDEVETFRRTGTGRHLRESQHAPDDVCPSYPKRKGEGWIPCPCASSSPTSKMPKKMGVRIAVVPASLIDGWRKSWATHIDPTPNELKLQLLLAHTASNLHAGTDEIASIGRNAALLAANPVHRGTDTAKKDQDRFLVLTTIQSYESFAKAFEYDKSNRGGRFQKIETLQEVKGLKLAWKTGGTKIKINFGIAVADECHESIFKGKGRPGVLAKLPGNPFCWGLSGTPFDQSPRAIEGMLWAIESQAIKSDQLALKTGWEQNPELRQFQWSNLDQIACEFQDLLKQPNPKSGRVDNVLNRFVPFLTTFMIRRDGESSQWFGHQLMRLNPHTHRDIYLQHNAAYDAEIERFGKAVDVAYTEELVVVQSEYKKKPRGPMPTVLKYDARMRVAFKLRLMATVPYLAKLGAAPYNLKLTPDELPAMREARKSIYAEHLDKIFESSPKLLWLRNFIRKLDVAKDIDGHDQKLVILTAFPLLAFIIRLVIEKYVPGGKDRVGEIHSRLKHNDRQAIIEAFTDEMKEGPDGVPKRKQKKDIRYLVGTTFLLAAGHQLTRSCNVVLMEPAYIFYHEKQAYARVHRIGQKNSASFSYRLIDEGSEIEKQMLCRHVSRNDFVGKARKAHDIPDSYLAGDILSEGEPRFSFKPGAEEGLPRKSYISPEAPTTSSSFPPRGSSLEGPPNFRYSLTSAGFPPRKDSLTTKKDSLATKKDILPTKKESLATRKGILAGAELSKSSLAQEIGRDDEFNEEARSINGSPQELHPGVPVGEENEVTSLDLKLTKKTMPVAQATPTTPLNLNPLTPMGDSPDWTPPRLR